MEGFQPPIEGVHSRVRFHSNRPPLDSSTLLRGTMGDHAEVDDTPLMMTILNQKEQVHTHNLHFSFSEWLLLYMYEGSCS